MRFFLETKLDSSNTSRQVMYTRLHMINYSLTGRPIVKKLKHSHDSVLSPSWAALLSAQETAEPSTLSIRMTAGE